MTDAGIRTLVQSLALANGASGLLVAAAATPALAGPLRIFVDLVLWPLDGTASLAAPETRLLAAILGGILAGFMAIVWMTAAWILPREPVLGRRMILGGLLTWCTIDSAGSLLAGSPANVAINLVILAAFTLPLLRLGPAAPARA